MIDIETLAKEQIQEEEKLLLLVASTDLDLRTREETSQIETVFVGCGQEGRGCY